MQEIITVTVSRYLTDRQAGQIAEMQYGSADSRRVRQSLFDELIHGNDCFGVIAENAAGEVVGRIHCIRNTDEPGLWYYGDLFVAPAYRRRGIASRLVEAAKAHLADTGASVLRCYVKPDNIPSLRLQQSLGFAEKPFAPFNMLENGGQIMLECPLAPRLSVIPATAEEAYFVRHLFVQNREALHTENITLPQWRELLAADDPDERHVLLCRGAVPAGYMKLNGLDGAGTAWISMLLVAPVFQRQGIGTFAVRYAEETSRAMGFTRLALQTDQDNRPAQNCCRKNGFTAVQYGEKCVFMKELV